MAWQRYEKIPLSTKVLLDVSPKAEWIVTEKLHGANFSIFCDATGGVSFAKRSGVLAPDDDFYSFRSQRLDERLRGPALRVRDEARRVGLAADGDSVCVFGELVGGRFPHPDVPPVPGLTPVQCGIWYCAGLHFVAFDLAVTPASGGERRFVGFHAAAAACEAAGFMFAEALASGNLQECLAVPHHFVSRLPSRLGLPPLDSGNMAEGVVVRTASGAHRALFKRKIEEFNEVQYSNPQWAASKAGGARAREDRTEELRYEMLARVTEQRLNAVESKVGRAIAADRDACRRLLADFKEDVLAALEEEGVAVLGALPDVLRVELNSAARELIGPILRRREREGRTTG